METKKGYLHQRMVFSDITASSLTWRWKSSIDQGRTWTLAWELLYPKK
ncbi:MAG: hypothetical protein P1R58_03455 [bacterium]|nr:hypothetical protein [bacterium]